MNSDALLPIAAVVAAFATVVMVVKFQRDMRERERENASALMQSRAQTQRFRQELKDISSVMRGHLGQSLEQRQRQQALESRMVVLESLQASTQALSNAKTRLAEGQSLGPMIQRGTLNASEAHLLSLVHRKQKASAAG